MEAAEGVFGGEFDNITEDSGDTQMAGPSGAADPAIAAARMKVRHTLYRLSRCANRVADSRI